MSSDNEILLSRLEEEERQISRRRARLHSRIDFLRANGNADGSPATLEQLEALDQQERALSRQRRQLHAQIRERAAGRHETDRS